MVKKGRFKKRQVREKKEQSRKSSSTSSEEEKREKIDPILVNSILESYLSNPERKRAVKNPIGVLDDGEIGVFLALEALIRGRGVSKIGHFKQKILTSKMVTF